MNDQQYLGYPEVIAETGLPKRTLLDRIARTGVRVYVDPRDHRRRVIDRRDIPKLVQVQEVDRATKVAA